MSSTTAGVFFTACEHHLLSPARGRGRGMTMQPGAWMKEFPGAITVCDAKGIILEMNDRACETFARDGGRDLVGSSVFDCHPEPAKSKLRRVLDDRSTNCYTTEKNGVKKLIYQAPWYEEGQYMGLVELAIELPPEVPNFIR